MGSSYLLGVWPAQYEDKCRLNAFVILVKPSKRANLLLLAQRDLQHAMGRIPAMQCGNATHRFSPKPPG